MIMIREKTIRHSTKRMTRPSTQSHPSPREIHDSTTDLHTVQAIGGYTVDPVKKSHLFGSGSNDLVGGDGGAAVEDVVALDAADTAAAEILDRLNLVAVADAVVVDVEETVVAVLVIGVVAGLVEIELPDSGNVGSAQADSVLAAADVVGLAPDPLLDLVAGDGDGCDAVGLAAPGIAGNAIASDARGDEAEVGGGESCQAEDSGGGGYGDLHAGDAGDDGCFLVDEEWKIEERRLLKGVIAWYECV
jgi:hypothetical protein